jgi:hypothetical protein
MLGNPEHLRRFLSLAAEQAHKAAGETSRE